MSNESKIKVEERGRKAIFLNPQQTTYEVGRIDGCLVNTGKKADYFVSNATKTVIVELKGKDIRQACAQLFEAAEHPSVKPHIKGSLGFLVICSRVPAADTSVQVAQQKARKKFGAKFRIFCNQRELSISDC
ncbi:hypothetical protein [Pannonibacter tanglangensis]|uniref:Uncharacterized protein n=1 Tax=Pannonibacter tanglangensis TaxID=2750084 RepID=A0ABW9ZFU1_9HYPH|nr:hypothetical protein [Pannonibacter sp. XCT-34]NBN63316.1 hypothetical protein [Pannonibacter sp. XCT-34]